MTCRFKAQPSLVRGMYTYGRMATWLQKRFGGVDAHGEVKVLEERDCVSKIEKSTL